MPKLKGKKGYGKKTTRVRGYSYTRNGKRIRVNPYERKQWIKTKTTDQIKKEMGKKAKRLKIRKNPLEMNETDLKNLSRDKLDTFAKELGKDLGYNLKDIEFDSRTDKEHSVMEMIKEKKRELELRKLDRTELLDLVHLNSSVKGIIKLGIETREDLISFLRNNIFLPQLSEWKQEELYLNVLSDNDKFALLNLRDNQYMNRYELMDLLGRKRFQILEKDNIFMRYGSSYTLTEQGKSLLENHSNFYENLNLPEEKIMEKEIPHNIILSSKELVEGHNREYSIGIDFERELEQPQQILIQQGATDFTYKLNDFEIYGHSHPNKVIPNPSRKDLLNLRYGKPEFIIGGKKPIWYGNEQKPLEVELERRLFFFNIEDPKKYNEWKRETNPKIPKIKINLDRERERFFKATGIKIYPYKKGLKLKLMDDPKLEKGFPKFNYEQLQEISENVKKQGKEKNAN
jgi:hypothetical protein